MKIRAAQILILLMLVLMTVSAEAADNRTSAITAGTVVVVNNPDPHDRLNLRTKPSQYASSLGKYYNGTYLNVLDVERDGWVKVRVFDLEGYMLAKFLVSSDQLQFGAATVPTVTIRNSGGLGLNLRETQSMSSASLGLYRNGSTVRVFGVSETWCHVQTEDGNVGFMLRERLSPVLEFQKNSNTNTSINSGMSQPVNNRAVVNNPNSVDRLNLRTMPSQSAPTLGKYYSGTTVEVLGSDQNGWTKVRIHSLEGYMMTQYLTFGQDQFAVGYAMPSVKIKNMNGTGLNLRQEQSMSSASLGLYRNGSTVRVFGVSETWCHVQTEDGNVGFMLRERLSPVLEFQKNSNTNTSINSGMSQPVNNRAVVNNPNSVDRLNLRTMPSQSAPTLGKYYSGTTVEVLGSDQNGWTKVRIHSLEGYMMTQYLTFGQDQFAVGYAMPSVKIKNMNGTGLNLRQGQSMSSASLGLYRNGSTVRVFGVSETWCHVQTEDGHVGFMLREDLSPAPDFEKSFPTGDDLEGSWFGKPGNPITDDFMPGGNG